MVTHERDHRRTLKTSCFCWCNDEHRGIAIDVRANIKMRIACTRGTMHSFWILSECGNCFEMRIM